MVDQGSVTPPPQILEDEQVQKEPSHEEEPQETRTDEVLKEGKMVEYSQPTSQDTKVQTRGCTKIESTEEEPSQREATPRRIDKGKEVAKHTPSSMRGRYSTE